MRYSAFQMLKSSIVPKRLYSYYSEVAQQAYTVWLDKGQLRLESESATQSFGKFYHAFSVPFEATELNMKAIDSVCIIGFGLGSIIDVLHAQRIYPKRILAIDCDAKVFDIYSKYHPNPFPVKSVVANVWDWLATAQPEPFDLICVDAYFDQIPSLPDEMHVAERFFDLLQPDGRLYWSFPYDDPHSFTIANAFDYFPIRIEAPTNDILVWEKDSSTESEEFEAE